MNLNYRLLGTPQNQQQRTLYFLVEAKSRVREVYSQTCLHFVKQGMLDTELFGLSVLIGKINYMNNLSGSSLVQLFCFLFVQIKNTLLRKFFNQNF